MSLSFTPKNEDELFDLLPEGVYPFKVKSASPHTSQATGNQSIKLELDVKGKEVKCYLSANYLFLLKHFCDHTGLEDAYKAGKLDAGMCVGKAGHCKIIVEEPEPGTNYFPKNVVKDFFKPDASKQASASPNDEGFDEDLPF